MEKKTFLIGTIFLFLGILVGIIGMGIINSGSVVVDEIEGPNGNLIGTAIKSPLGSVPIKPPSPPREGISSSSSSSGKKTYNFAGTLNYCVDRNSAVTAYINWEDEIRTMPLGLNTYKVKLSNYNYYKINFCKVEVGQYEDCNSCWAELEN